MAEYDKIERAKTKIQEAKSAFSSNKNDAISALGAAYAELRLKISLEWSLLSLPRGAKLDREAADMFNKASEILTLLALGVDLTKFTYVNKLMPHTSVTMGGTYQSTHWRQYNDLDTKSFDFCVDFVESLSTKAQELVNKPH